MILKVENLSVSYSNVEILKNINFEVEKNDWLMIIGPNGAGKTTIVNAIAQSAPYTGKITINNRDLKTMKSKERAKEIGVLMQNHYVSYNFKVKDVVGLGAYSRSGGVFSTRTKSEEEVLKEALNLTGMEGFENRSVLTLSGGELQRTFLSQLLVQNAKLMILDEPTNHLDLVYQESIFDLIKDWKEGENRGVISVVHDLRLAKMYGNKALLLKDGEIFSFGNIDEVMTRENLREVYKMDVYDWMNRLSTSWRI